MQNKNPIGFFDSGVGGTSIWKEMIHLLPYESTIYLADSNNAPYGQKNSQEIIELSEKNTEFLLNRNCKMIVVACNTATTNAITHLRNKYDIPFIGIEPAIKPAALQTKTKAVGILATQGTLSSELFAKTSNKFAKDITVVEQQGTGLVELIESNAIDSKEMEILLKRYLNPMLQQHIDHLILGCTHYPYLIPKIKKIIGRSVKIIDSGFAVSKQIQNILQQNNLLNREMTTPNYQFYTNKDAKVLHQLLSDVKKPLQINFLDF
jgi:glutamate racemase